MTVPPQDQALTLATPGDSETRVRGSRFLGVCARAASRAEAENIVLGLEKKYHAATHHCWAWRCLDNPEREFFQADDGEPSGSAGQPILQALEAESLCGVVCVVTRWFGGTKLGVGGLVRAYGEAASLSLNRAVKIAGMRAELFGLSFEYPLFGRINQVLESEPVVVTRRDFGQTVGLNIAVALSRARTLHEALVEAAAGRLECIPLGRSTVFDRQITELSTGPE